jgi:hypothetical protein
MLARPAYGLVGGSSSRKFRSPRKNKCDVEYIVVDALEREPGKGGKSSEPTMWW